MSGIKGKSGGAHGGRRPAENISIGRSFKIRSGQPVLINRQVRGVGDMPQQATLRIEFDRQSDRYVIQLELGNEESIAIVTPQSLSQD